MSNVGRSTAAHVPDRELSYSRGHTQLVNWGNWISSIAGGTASAVSPMFREYVAGYRETSGLRIYDEDQAVLCDAIIARCCRPRDVHVLMARYVAEQSSREASRRMTHIGYPCTHTGYAAWLDAAVARVDVVLELRDA